MKYNRKPASCFAMQFTGENTDEVLAFLNEHTEGEWSIYETQDYYIQLSNPFWARGKVLFKDSWVVIHSKSKVQMMSNSDFKRDWEQG